MPLIIEDAVVVLVMIDTSFSGVHQLHVVAQFVLINGQFLHPFNPAPIYPSLAQKPFKCQGGPLMQSYASFIHDPLDLAAQKAQLFLSKSLLYG